MSLTERLGRFYDAFSRRTGTAGPGYKPATISPRLRGRILTLYAEVVSGRLKLEDWALTQDHSRAFFPQVHQALRLVYGRARLSRAQHHDEIEDLVKDAKRRRFDVLVVWRLDRLGRNLRHLILLLDDLQATGVAFVSLSEGIDATTPAGRLQLHVLASIAEFERDRIRERVVAGLDRVKRQGKRLGRPEVHIPESTLAPVRGLSVREAARRLGVSAATAHRWLSQKTCSDSPLPTR